MSLDLSLIGAPADEPCTCQCGHKHMRIDRPVLFDVNITHNLNEMASEAGLYQAMWRSHGARAGDLVSALVEGVAMLKREPNRFQAISPKNGRDDYDGLLRTALAFLQACRDNPDATVEACR